MIVESLFSSINRGREGLNAGLSTGLSKLDGLVYGIQRRWMEVVAGDSGSKQYCRLYKKLYELLSGKIGEDCDVNTEVNLLKNKSL